jgi:predicted flavoprotein YhiN
LAHSGGQVVGTPQTNNELILIMLREYYTERKLISLLERLQMEVIEAGLGRVFITNKTYF